MTDTFHFFPKLPAELQLMVWQHYRKDRGAVRHYFRLSRHGRYHTAYNTETGYYERATGRTGADAQRDPMDPTLTKIRFTGRVRSVPDNGHPDPEVARRRRLSAVSMALGWGRFGARPHSVTTTHAWVHFADDIFVFENSGYARPGKLRFLASGIYHDVPRPPAAGSWPARIRTLALHQHGAPLAPSDHAILRMMDSLRTLLLVYGGHACAWFPDTDEWNVAEYVDMEQVIEKGSIICHCRGYRVPGEKRFPHVRIHVEIMETLMQSLGKGGVKVKAVFDCRQYMRTRR